MPQLKSKPPLDHRDRDSFNFAREITRPFGAIEAVLDWAKREVEGEWRWQLIEVSSERRPGRYIFYFDSERDFLAFLLKYA